jgi:hypothetical protein
MDFAARDPAPGELVQRFQYVVGRVSVLGLESRGRIRGFAFVLLVGA